MLYSHLYFQRFCDNQFVLQKQHTCVKYTINTEFSSLRLSNLFHIYTSDSVSDLIKAKHRTNVIELWTVGNKSSTNRKVYTESEKNTGKYWNCCALFQHTLPEHRSFLNPWLFIALWLIKMLIRYINSRPMLALPFDQWNSSSEWRDSLRNKPCYIRIRTGLRHQHVDGNEC